jgi:hypothetical protein
MLLFRITRSPAHYALPFVGWLLLGGLGKSLVAQELEAVYQLGGTGYCDTKNTAIDAAGNVYMIGSFSGTVDFDPSAATERLTSTSDQDIFVAKYDNEGALVFVNQMQTTTAGNSISYAEDIAVDTDGNVFVAVSFVNQITLGTTVLGTTVLGTTVLGTTVLTSTSDENGESSRDILLARYSRSGELAFAYAIGGTGTDYGYALAMTPDSKLLLTGRFQRQVDFDPGPGSTVLEAEDNSTDIYLARYNLDGTLDAAVTEGGTDYQIANVLTVDGQGNVIIGGTYRNRLSFNRSNTFNHPDTRNGFVAKYDADLRFRWALPLRLPQNRANEDWKMTLYIQTDPADNVLVTGKFVGLLDVAGQRLTAAESTSDIYLTRIRPDGTPDFARRYGGAGDEETRDVTVGPDGTIYLVGNFAGELNLDPDRTDDNLTAQSGSDGFLAQLDPSGNYRSAQPFRGNDDVTLKRLIVSPADPATMLLTGMFDGTLALNESTSLSSSGEADVFFARYDLTLPPPPTPAPVLTALSAYRGQAGDTIQLRGQNFGEAGADNTVTFGETGAEVLSVNAAGTELSVRVPELAPGPYSVAVRVGDALAVADQMFQVGDLAPLITAVRPPVLKTDTVGTLVITGENFIADAGAVSVLVGDTPVAPENVRVNEAGTEITVTTPPLSAGTYALTVSVGGQTTASSQLLTVVETPVVDQTPPVVALTVPARLRSDETALSVSSAVTDESALQEVTLEFLPIRQNPRSSAWRRISPVREDNTDTYLARLTGTDLDELGVQIRVVATDVWGNTDTSAVRYTYREYTAARPLPIEGLAPAGEVPSANDYQLLALPLQNQSATQLLGPLGAYDTRRWRFWRLRDNSGDAPYEELNRGWSGDLVTGQGYMLIYTEATAFRAVGSVVEANHEAPYTITLQPGYNLIGNPYPFALDWEAVLAYNQRDPASLRLKTFDQGFREARSLPAFEGGLVINPKEGQPITLALPVGVAAPPSGRVEALASKSDAAHWNIPFTFSSADLRTWGSVGMHPAAQPGYDRHDDFPPPRLTDFLEAGTRHPEFFLSAFSHDVVPPAAQHHWEWEVATGQGNRDVTLRWDPADVGSLTKPLTLLDPARAQPIDMRTRDHHTFRVDAAGRYAFAVVYGAVDAVEFPDGTVRVGEPYPNPATDRLHLPVWLPNASGVTLEVFDRTGRRVGAQTYDQLSPGYQTLVWHRDGALPTGLYLYRWRFDNGGQMFNQRVLLE